MADEIVVKYTADTKELEKRLKAVEDQLGDIGDEAEKSGKKSKKAIDETGKSAEGVKVNFQRLGAAIVAAFAVQRIIDFGREMTKLAVTAETTAQRINVIFGKSAKLVSDAAKDMASSIGLSNQQFELLASQVGDLLVPIGLTREEAAKMSVETIKLAGALSEFSGGVVDTQQASEALSKAFLGETEGLKALGVSINSADIERKLAEKGQKDLEGQALATAKAFAVQELVMEKSADAQAFFAKNSDSLARRQKELEARTQTLREELAQKLSPIINKVTEAVLEFFNNISIDDIIRFAKGIGVAVAAFGAYRIASKAASGVQQIFSKGISASISPLGALSAGLTAITLLTKAFSGSASAAAEAQKRLSDALATAEVNANKEIRALERLVETAKDESNSRAIRENAINELQRIYPDYLGNLSLETINSQKAAAAIDQVTDSIQRRAKATALEEVLTENEKQIISLRQEVDALEKGLDGGILGFAKDALAAGGGADLDDLIASRKRQIRAIRNQNDELSDELRRTQDEEDKSATLARATGSGGQQGFGTAFGIFAQIGAAREKALDEQAKKDEENANKSAGVRKKTEQELLDELLKDFELHEETKLDITQASSDANQAILDTTLKKQKLNNILFEKDLQERRIQDLEDEAQHLQDRLLLTELSADERLDIEFSLAQKREEIANAQAQLASTRMQEQVEEVRESVDLISRFWNMLSEDQQKTIVNTFNTFREVLAAFGNEQKELAILDIVITKAKAIAEAIRLAVSTSANPALLAINIASAVASVLVAFKQIDDLLQEGSGEGGNTPRRFSKGVVMVTGDGSSTGDIIPALLSPRESVINAQSTRKYYDELSAINSGTFDRLVNAKYIIPAIEAQGQTVIVDAGFTDRNLINRMRQSDEQSKKQHIETLKALNKRVPYRKHWY